LQRIEKGGQKIKVWDFPPAGLRFSQREDREPIRGAIWEGGPGRLVVKPWSPRSRGKSEHGVGGQKGGERVFSEDLANRLRTKWAEKRAKKGPGVKNHLPKKNLGSYLTRTGTGQRRWGGRAGKVFGAIRPGESFKFT